MSSGAGVFAVGGTGFTVDANVMFGSVALPAGAQEGDFIVVAGAADIGAEMSRGDYTFATEGATLTMQTTGSDTFSGSAGPAGTIYTGFLAAGDTTLSVTVPPESANPAGFAVSATVFRNVDQTTPFDSAIAMSQSASGTDGMPLPPAQSSTAAGALHVVIGQQDDDQITDPIAPTGFTMGGHAAINNASTMQAYHLPTSPGTVTPDRFSSGTAHSDAWRAAHFTLTAASDQQSPQTIQGSGAGASMAQSATGSGLRIVGGSGAGAAPSQTASGSGNVASTGAGTGSGAAPSQTGSGTGVRVVAGNGAGVAIAQSGAGAGQRVVSGSGAGFARAQTGNGTSDPIQPLGPDIVRRPAESFTASRPAESYTARHGADTYIARKSA